MHKAILQAIQTQSLTLAMDFLTENLSGRTIGEVPVHPTAANPIVLAPQTLMMPGVKKIFAKATPGKAWTNGIPWEVIRTGVDRTTPSNIGHSCRISETSSPYMIGIIGVTAPPCGLNTKPKIGDIWKLTS